MRGVLKDAPGGVHCTGMGVEGLRTKTAFYLFIFFALGRQVGNNLLKLS